MRVLCRVDRQISVLIEEFGVSLEQKSEPALVGKVQPAGAIGKDVGILSQNTSTVKEIICGGITTFSTDFILMAKKSAEYVISREKIQTLIPSVLTRRTSL